MLDLAHTLIHLHKHTLTHTHTGTPPLTPVGNFVSVKKADASQSLSVYPLRYRHPFFELDKLGQRRKKKKKREKVSSGEHKKNGVLSIRSGAFPL